jgi:nucleotide-binding universal stress UspA family protein
MRNGKFKKILVPLDGSGISEEILPVVSQLGKRLNASVLLHSVVDPATYKPVVNSLETMANTLNDSRDGRQGDSLPSSPEAVLFTIVKEKVDHYLTLAMLKLAQSGVDAQALVTKGEPADEIVREAEVNQCDLIAMSTHGRNLITSSILGSVTSKVIHNSRTPVLAIAPERARDFLDKIWDGSEHGYRTTPSWRQDGGVNSWGEVLVARNSITTIAVLLDGSELAEGVLPYVGNLAQALMLEILLLRVVANDVPHYFLETPGAVIDAIADYREIDDAVVENAKGYLDNQAEVLRSRGIKVRTQVVRGSPAPTIIDYVHQNEISMIAMTTHGRSGVSRWILGSVADSLIRASRRPVLVIPSAKDDAD